MSLVLSVTKLWFFEGFRLKSSNCYLLKKQIEPSQTHPLRCTLLSSFVMLSSFVIIFLCIFKNSVPSNLSVFKDICIIDLVMTLRQH